MKDNDGQAAHCAIRLFTTVLQAVGHIAFNVKCTVNENFTWSIHTLIGVPNWFHGFTRACFRNFRVVDDLDMETIIFRAVNVDHGLVQPIAGDFESCVVGIVEQDFLLVVFEKNLA